MNKLKIPCLLVVFLLTCLTNCNQEKKTEPDNKQEDSQLAQYYKRNNWHYPVEIDVSNVSYGKGVEMDSVLHPTKIEQKILDWVVSDSVLLKHSIDKAVRISDISFTPVTTSTYNMMCRVDFYREGEIKEGLVAPVEGHGIVENKFLRQREIAIFTLDRDSLTFLNWKQ